MNTKNEFEDFLVQYDGYVKEADVHDRVARLERVRGLWEKYQGEDDVVSFEEIVARLANEDPAHKIFTGYERLDELVDGFRYQQLVILSAQEKSGKTAFALEIVSKMKEENPCYFLFEQSAQEIVRQRLERGQDIPIGYAPARNIDNTWKWIEERMMESMVKYGSRVFVIDNVDWLAKDYGSNRRTDEVMTDLLLKMKAFCKQWEVVIFLIAHVKKTKMEEIPQPDDIKETSAFKQIADLVLILWRKTKSEKVEGTKTNAVYRTNETLLWVAENRQSGKTGYMQMVFDGKSFSEKVWDANMDVTAQFDTYADEF